MKTYTPAQIAIKALRELNVVGVDETPDGTIQTDAENDVRACYAMLKGRKFQLWPEESCPDYIYLSFARYCAAEMAASYGREANTAVALANLVAVMAKRHSSQPAGLMVF